METKRENLINELGLKKEAKRRPAIGWSTHQQPLGGVAPNLLKP